LPTSPPISKALPGVHRVRKRNAVGSVTEFWYAWRGGPRILHARAKSEAGLPTLVARQMPDAIRAYEANRRPAADNRFLYGLISRYLESAAFRSVAERTRRDRRKLLDRVCGSTPTQAR
jgi:hypothetical protein